MAKRFRTFYEDFVRDQYKEATLEWAYAENGLGPRSPIVEQLYRYQQQRVDGVQALRSIFVRQGAPIYRLGRDFGEQLFKAKMKVPKAKYLLTDNVVRLIHFPESVRINGPKPGEYFTCAFVCLTANLGGHSLGELHAQVGKKPHPDLRVMVVSTPIFDTDGYTGMDEFLTVNIGADIAESLESAQRGSTSPIIEPYFMYLLKILLYLNSGDPDLREHRPLYPKPKKRRQRLKWERANLCDVPITYVGYDWKKGRNYRVGSTVVTGHFRWQPYGPGLTKVKLIWIDEHERAYDAVKSMGDRE